MIPQTTANITNCHRPRSIFWIPQNCRVQEAGVRANVRPFIDQTPKTQAVITNINFTPTDWQYRADTNRTPDSCFSPHVRASFQYLQLMGILTPNRAARIPVVLTPERHLTLPTCCCVLYTELKAAGGQASPARDSSAAKADSHTQ